MKENKRDAVSVNLSDRDREALNRIKEAHGIEADATALRRCIMWLNQLKEPTDLQDNDRVDYKNPYGDEYGQEILESDVKGEKWEIKSIEELKPEGRRRSKS